MLLWIIDNSFNADEFDYYQCLFTVELIITSLQ